MVHEGDRVAIFHSVHKIMKAEKLLKAAGEPILLIPVPRQLSSDCGLALRVSPEAWASVERRLAEAEMLPQEVYHLQGGSYERQL